MGEPEKVVYRHVVESFVKHVIVRRGLLMPDFIRELDRLGVKVEKPSDLSQENFFKLIETTATRLGKGKSRAEGQKGWRRWGARRCAATPSR